MRDEHSVVTSAPAVLWYRRDLRIHDLPALNAAVARGPVAPLFIFDPKLLGGRWPSPNRSAFLLGSLISLDVVISIYTIIITFV